MTQERTTQGKGLGWRNIVRALGYLRPYWVFQLVALGCAVVAAFLDLVQPWVYKLFIDDVIPNRDARMLGGVCALLLGSIVVRVLFSTLRGYLFTHVGERAVIDMRHTLFSHFQRLSMSFFNREKTGRLMSVFTNDVPAMQGLYTSTLTDFVTDTLRFVVTLGVMFAIDWQLTLLALPSLPLFAVALFLFSKPVRTISREVQESRAAISENLHESLAGVREVKSFTREAREVGRLRSVFERLLGLRVRQSILHSAADGAAHLTAVVGVLLVLWLGGMKAVRGEMKAGVLIAFIQYMAVLFGPVHMYMRVNNRIQSAMGAAERLFDALDIVPEIADKPDAVALPSMAGRVEFDAVHFAYDGGAEVLTDITLSAEPGEMIALVGPSGAGKSTLVSLIPRFYDPASGRIRIDGHDLTDVTQQSLREQIGMVFQDPFLFGTSVRENIGFGKQDATDDEIEAAARAAHAHDFITQLPDGYDTEIGERGVKLSGGQKQRISIARSILRDPRILILDEATSSLDSESEQLVKAALDELMAARTSFVIAHRLSTVLQADRIVVLDKGRIESVGTHQELLARGGLYAKLYDAQFGDVTS